MDDVTHQPPFVTVVADPPWQYRDKLRMGVRDDGTPQRGHRGAESHYDCLTLEAIAAMGDPQDGSIAGFPIAPHAHLYLWTTNAFMREAHGIAEAWGFTPRTILTWVKTSIGMGFYFRNTTEHVIFAVRGSLRCRHKDQSTDFAAPRAQHSQKPDIFYSIVERMSPGPYLDLFARRERAGWVSWGDQLASPEAPHVV